MTQMLYHHTSTAQNNLKYCQQLYVQTGDLKIQLLVVFKCILGNITGIPFLERKVFDMDHR